MIGVWLWRHIGVATIKTIGVNWLDHIAPLNWSSKGDLGHARVKTLAAPLVIGVIGIGAKNEQRLGVATGVQCPQHKKGMAGCFRPLHAVAAQGHFIETGAPLLGNRKGKGDVPVATGGVGMGRGRLLHAWNSVALPNNHPLGTDPGNFYREGRDAG